MLHEEEFPGCLVELLMMLKKQEFPGCLLELLMMLKKTLYLVTVNICLDQYTFNAGLGTRARTLPHPLPMSMPFTTSATNHWTIKKSNGFHCPGTRRKLRIGMPILTP